MVARRGGPTYARDAGATCWSRLAPSAPRTLEDVGISFPYNRQGMKVMRPQATSFGWRLKSENKGRYWFLAVQRKYVPSPKR